MDHHGDWIQNLKVGDRVVKLSGGGIGSCDSISTVERFTKTLIITKSGGRFSRLDGTQSAGHFCDRITQPTQELVDKIIRDVLIRKFTRYDWNELPIQTLREIRKLLP